MPTTKVAEAPAQQAQNTLAAMSARIAALEKRLVQVEGMLQNSSAMALSPEMVSHIAGMAVEQVKTDVLQQLGMSGFPARGDA